MYEGHWKLNGLPFENWGGVESYFPSPVHESAVLQLKYQIEQRRAIVTLCGDCGTGKTMIIDRLAERLDESAAPLSRVVFPPSDAGQLLGHIADELTGCCGPADEPQRLTLRRLNDFFEKNIAADRQAVLVIDEAHLLTSGDQLEMLRMLINLRRTAYRGESPVTLLLVGQPTLLTQVERYRALDDRISAKCWLDRFTAEQSADYIRHRLRAAGASSAMATTMFSDDALETLHLRAMGIPRRINRLADLALMVGYAEEASRIEAEQIDGIHQELVAAA